MPIRFAPMVKRSGAPAARRPAPVRPAPQASTPALPARKAQPLQIPPVLPHESARKPESPKLKAQRAKVDSLAKQHDAMLTDPKRTAGALTSLAVQLYQEQVKLSAMIQKG